MATSETAGFPPHEAHIRAQDRAEGLGHELFRSRVAALERDTGRESAAADLTGLETVALKAGAYRSRAIATAQVTVDERVTMKCRVPPCEMYGMNHLCPPFSPTATEFAGYLRRYEHGLLVQVRDRLPDGFKELVEATDDAWYCELYRLEEWEKAYSRTMMPLWHRLHSVVLAVERAAFRQGHHGAVSLAASNCGFCDPVGLAERAELHGLRPAAGDVSEAATRESSAPEYAWCDVAAPCPFPQVARPAMEAVGIDVVRTLRNAGWELQFPATAYLEEGVAYWTGLVLVA